MLGSLIKLLDTLSNCVSVVSLNWEKDGFSICYLKSIKDYLLYLLFEFYEEVYINISG